MINKRRLVPFGLALLTVAAATLAVAGPAAAAAGNRLNPVAESYKMRVKSGSSIVGWVDFAVNWTTKPLVISTAVKDTAANSSGPYAKITVRDHATHASYGTYTNRNTVGSGKISYLTMNFAIPAVSQSRYEVVVETGNCAGSTCTASSTDIAAFGYLSTDFTGGGVSWDPLGTSREYHVFGDTYLYMGPGYSATNYTCNHSPSSTNCPVRYSTVSSAGGFYLLCQQVGTGVNNNPYWLQINIDDSVGAEPLVGWIPSWYLDYPKNWVDDLPYCDY